MTSAITDIFSSPESSQNNSTPLPAESKTPFDDIERPSFAQDTVTVETILEDVSILENRGLLETPSAEDYLLNSQDTLRLGVFFNSGQTVSNFSEGELVVRMPTSETKQYGVAINQNIYWMPTSLQEQSEAEDTARAWLTTHSFETEADDIATLQKLETTTPTELLTDLTLGTNIDYSQTKLDTVSVIRVSEVASNTGSYVIDPTGHMLVTGIFTNATGDVSAVILQDGTKVDMSGGAQLVEFHDDRLGLLGVNGAVNIFSDAQNPAIAALRGPDAKRETFIGLATLAETSLFSSEFEDVNPIHFFEEHIDKIDTLNEAQLAYDIVLKWGNLAQQKTVKSALQRVLTHVLETKLSSEDASVVSKPSDFNNKADEVLEDVDGIKDAADNLREANLSDSSDAKVNAGQELATRIIEATQESFTTLNSAALSISALATRLSSYYFRISNTFKISNQFDVTKDGLADEISFLRQESDYVYTVSAVDGGLVAQDLNFSLDTVTTYSSHDMSDRIVDTNAHGIVDMSTQERYFLNLDVHFQELFENVTKPSRLHVMVQRNNETLGGNAIELSYEEYQHFVNMYGENGSFSAGEATEVYKFIQGFIRDPRLSDLKVHFTQTDASQGINYYADIDGNGIIDRVEQYVDLSDIAGPSHDNPPFIVYFRDDSGNEIYSIVGNTLEEISEAAKLRPFVLQYIASHKNLIRKFGSGISHKLVDATEHFLKKGDEWGIKFDPALYLLSNPDLFEHYKNDAVGATLHYISYGYKEKRSAELPSVETLMSHDVLKTHPKFYLDMLSATFPSLTPLYNGRNVADVKTELAAFITHALLKIAPQTTPQILSALANTSLIADAQSPESNVPVSEDLKVNNLVTPQNAHHTKILNTDLRLLFVKDNENQFALHKKDADGLVWSSDVGWIEDFAELYALPANRENVGVTLSSLTNDILIANQYIVSENNDFFAVFQADGNFEIYAGQRDEPEHLIWSSGTGGKAEGGFLAVSDYGEIVIYDDRNRRIWSSETRNANAERVYTLSLKDDGSLILVDVAPQKTLWSSDVGVVERPVDNTPILELITLFYIVLPLLMDIYKNDEKLLPILQYQALQEMLKNMVHLKSTLSLD